MIIHGYVISALGHCANQRDYDSTKLHRPAVDYLAKFLATLGSHFRAGIPIKGLGQVDLDWSSASSSCGTGTFYSKGELLATDVIVSGIKPDEDQRALEAAQNTLEEICGEAGEGVEEELLIIPQRPAMASIRWSTKELKAVDLVGDMEVCLAAAFLERAVSSREIGL